MVLYSLQSRTVKSPSIFISKVDIQESLTYKSPSTYVKKTSFYRENATCRGMLWKKPCVNSVSYADVQNNGVSPRAAIILSVGWPFG